MTEPVAARRATLIVPAYNEAARVTDVIDAVRDHPRLGEIIVVDNASMDDTARVAAEAGARVISMPVPGKGIAMAAGVASQSADTVVFLDADLVDLRRIHVDQLLDPIDDGTAAMSRGLLDHGRRTLARARLGPVLTGQRAMRTDVFERLLPADVANWGVEQALNTIAKRYGFPVKDVVLGGLDHVDKTKKYATWWEGNKVRMNMLASTQTARFGVIERHRQLRGGAEGVENAVSAARRVLDALNHGEQAVFDLASAARKLA